MKNSFFLISITAIFLFSNTFLWAQHEKDAELQNELEAALKDFKGTAGVYVYNLKTEKEAGVNPDTIFPTASIVKVPILVGIFKKIVDGELNYHQHLMYRDSLASGGSGLMQYFKDSTEIDLSVPISLMISRSDNTAALWCQQMAGGGKAINAWLKENGYKYTRVNSRTKGREKQHQKYGWGQTTPREMARLLWSIREKKILTPAATERMYRNMTNVYWDDYALSEVPPYVQVASKQGMVNASRSELVMVNAPSGDYVFYIATKNNKDQSWEPDNGGWQLARKVSKLLWDYFEPNSAWSPATHSQRWMDWKDDGES